MAQVEGEALVLRLVAGGRLLALPMQATGEIFELARENLTVVGSLPPGVLGLVNWRGRPLWVLALAHLTGHLPAVTARLRLVLVRSGDALAAIAVDGVEGVFPAEEGGEVLDPKRLFDPSCWGVQAANP